MVHARYSFVCTKLAGACGMGDGVVCSVSKVQIGAKSDRRERELSVSSLLLEMNEFWSGLGYCWELWKFKVVENFQVK